MNFHKKNTLLTALGLMCVLFSGLASAHAGHEVSVSFMSGLMHPLTGIDHLLVIVLVGFWSAFVLKSVWLGPYAFLTGMCLGVLAGIVGFPLGLFEFGIAASVIAIGLLLLVNKQYSPRAILILLGAFGIFHGFAHTQQFSNSSFGASFVAQDIAGLILATANLHFSGAVLVKFLKDKTSVIAKIAGFASVIYGSVLFGQLSFALLGGASV